MSSIGGKPTDTVELLCCWNMGVLVRVYLYVVSLVWECAPTQLPPSALLSLAWCACRASEGGERSTGTSATSSLWSYSDSHVFCQWTVTAWACLGWLAGERGTGTSATSSLWSYSASHVFCQWTVTAWACLGWLALWLSWWDPGGLHSLLHPGSTKAQAVPQWTDCLFYCSQLAWWPIRHHYQT